jgi:hypothetical protein
MTMNRAVLFLTLALAAAQAVAQHAKIDPAAFPPPKTIVLVDVPRMVPGAQIGVLTMYMPGNYQHHFTERVDRFFEVPAAAPQPGDVARSAVVSVDNSNPYNQGLIGGMIMSNARETQRRAEGFEGEILKLDPAYDLRASFMSALVARLQANGVEVRVDAEGRGAMPRLRWPALDANGKPWPSGAADSAAAVDADLLVQVCPVAFYQSAGPLNGYKRSATVAVALYEGRTKKFVGRQTVRFVAPDSRFEYYKYDTLLQALPEAAPALREALVSLAAPVADLASGKRAP